MNTPNNLLMRFYEINGGEIVVDGVNTTEMTRHELRRHFGMVLQETWLFEGTIRDNLKYGATREVSDEEMIRVSHSDSLAEKKIQSVLVEERF